MQENSELMLDQLWFTWSTSGLGSMPMGFRVRAASEGLYDTQGMRYRRVNRFVNYELPQGVSASEFSPNIAPISLSLVNNGEERLLIRKVYTGLDAAGRNVAFFTHLVAGLPREFTARDAIRLWYCPNMWVESEAGKPSHDMRLEKIRYSDIHSYVGNSQTSFNVAPISEPLQNLLVLILTKGLPQRILVRGHSTMIAPLIYGLTHALPMKLLPGLTFTTYESNVQESETLITGTINGAELNDITRIQVQPGQATGPIPADLHRYVLTAVNALQTGSSMEKLSNVIDEIDRRDHATVEDLIELFNRRFRHGPLKPKQLEDTLLYPAENLEDLADPAFQEEATRLLLSQPDYWKSHGKQVFQQVVNRLTSSAQTRSDQQAREPLTRFVNSMIDYLFSTIQTELSQGTLPSISATVLSDIAHPSIYPATYLRMLTEFAKEPIYARIRTEALWSFQIWLLSCAKLIKPLPTWEQIFPWLHISSWDKLEQVLRLDLPGDWEHMAIYELLSANREIPKRVYTFVKTYEAKFIRSMQSILIQGSQHNNQEWISMVLRLFAAIIRYDEQDHNYPNRVGLLIALLNAVPNDSQVTEALFALVPIVSPYQLTLEEFDHVVAGCRPEVFAAGGASPSLMKYLQEYILALTPKKLNPNTISLLEQFQRASVTLPEATANLVNYWLVINTFLANQSFDSKKLRNIKPVLQPLMPLLRQRGQNIWQTFIEELTPYLTILIENEHQIQSVLNVFEGARVVARWDMLNVLVARAGATHFENLSRLFPYVISGIREHIHARKSESTLDAYFQLLFARVNENALNEVDKALSAGVWPMFILTEWKSWRERSKVSIVEKIRSGLPFQQPRPQTDPRMEKAQSTNTSDTVFFSITVDRKKYNVTNSQYQQSHQILAWALPYWGQVLHENANRDSTGSIAFEEKIIRNLFEELTRQRRINISKYLTEYLIDEVLIEMEIVRLHRQGNEVASSILNPENYLATHLLDFQAYVGKSTYQQLCDGYGEKTIKESLSGLIRRHHFILYLAQSSKGGWKRWLEQERRRATIEYASHG